MLRRTLSDQTSFLPRNKPVSRPYGLLQIMKCHDDSVAIFPLQAFQSFPHLAMLAEVEVRGVITTAPAANQRRRRRQ